MFTSKLKLIPFNRSILWFKALSFRNIRERFHNDNMANALESLYSSEGVEITGATRTCSTPAFRG